MCVCEVCEVLDSILHFREISRDKGFKKKSVKSKNNPPAVAQKALHLPYKGNQHVNRLSVTYWEVCFVDVAGLYSTWIHTSNNPRTRASR